MSPNHREFGTREQQKLRYRARNATDRHFARALKIMTKLGWENLENIPPKPRPKRMRQKTYDRLCQELVKEHAKAMCAGLGYPPPDLGDEGDDVIRGKYCEAEANKCYRRMNGGAVRPQRRPS